MPQLIKLRQRIKLIGTIQKITQAMRLVSMSVHSRLNNQLIYLKSYQSELNRTFLALQHANNANLKTTIDKKLIILIGSQKGLCGAFNQEVLNKYNTIHQNDSTTELIVIGKKLIDTVQQKYTINRRIPKLTPTVLSEISTKIFTYITQQKNFSEVICISNQSKSFFAHTTKITQIIPLPTTTLANSPSDLDPYIWEQSEAEIYQLLIANQIKLNIYCTLFDSLIAEYSARFRSMDNAARNARTLLEAAERQYSKLRQAKITGELVELSAIFQTK